MSRTHDFDRYDDNVRPRDQTRLRNGQFVPTIEAVQCMEKLLTDFHCMAINGEELVEGLWRCAQTDQTREDPLDDGSASMLMSLGYLRANGTLPNLVRNVVLSAVMWCQDRRAIQSPFAEEDVHRAFLEARRSWDWLPRKRADDAPDMIPRRSLITEDESNQELTTLKDGALVPRTSGVQVMVAISPLAIRKPIDTWPAWVRLMVPLHMVCNHKDIDGGQRKDLMRQHFLETDGTPNLTMEKIVRCAIRVEEKEVVLTRPFQDDAVHLEYLNACRTARVPIHPANPSVHVPIPPLRRHKPRRHQ